LEWSATQETSYGQVFKKEAMSAPDYVNWTRYQDATVGSYLFPQLYSNVKSLFIDIDTFCSASYADKSF
jgi:hypothetical protein